MAVIVLEATFVAVVEPTLRKIGIKTDEEETPTNVYVPVALDEAYPIVLPVI
jgi:hypothetical protein